MSNFPEFQWNCLYYSTNHCSMLIQHCWPTINFHSAQISPSFLFTRYKTGKIKIFEWLNSQNTKRNSNNFLYNIHVSFIINLNDVVPKLITSHSAKTTTNLSILWCKYICTLYMYMYIAVQHQKLIHTFPVFVYIVHLGEDNWSYLMKGFFFYHST